MKIFHASSIAVGLIALLMVMSPAIASSRGPTVHILGDNSSRINQRLLSTYHFTPGKIRVNPGATVTFTDTGPCSVPFDCTHTISLVNQADLPVNATQVFACLLDLPGTVCANIGDTNFPTGPSGTPVLRANVTGEPSGFQGGNSFVIVHGQSLEIVITAPAGTTLHYMCAIHPWMQGSITVGSSSHNTENEGD